MPKKDDVIERKVGERVDIICSFAPGTVKDLGDGVFETVVTTSDVDRQNESITTEGISTDGWVKTGMPVLYGHDYDGLPIGKGLSFKQLKNKMTSRFQLAVKEYPFAATIAEMIKGGYLNAASIGGVVKQWSPDYSTIEQMDMVEFSIVPIPANASAIITARSFAEQTGKSFEDIREEYQDFARKVLLDKVSSMGDDDIKDAIGVLEKLLATLKESASSHSIVGDKPEIRRIKHITLRDSAKAVATQSQRIIKIVKLKS